MHDSSSTPPPPKRIKRESASPDEDLTLLPGPEVEVEVESDEDHCTICLQPIADRAVIPTCSHEFCFECLMIWSQQSRRCPLCAQAIGDYLIHHIRSTHDYQKHFLPPLRTSPRPLSRTDGARIAHVRRPRERVWGPHERAAQEKVDALERAVARRRWIYQQNLYAKHVASNQYTRYRPYPTPAQFAASPDLISRMAIFLRRELLVWPNADVEFLVTFVISLMKSIDIRSESAIKLLAEFLDMDTPYAPGERHVNAEHFAHEIYCYLRSPYRDLGIYDSLVQYDIPPGIPPPPSHERTYRWEPGPSQSHSQSPNLPTSHSHSRHPLLIRERNVRPEQTPSHAFSHERAPRGSIGARSPVEDSRVHVGVARSESDDDDRPAARRCLRSPARDKTKGKQRALSRPLSPSPDSDILCSSQLARHERTGSPAPSLSTFENTSAKGTNVAASALADNIQPCQTLESGDSTRFPVVSCQPPNGSTGTIHTTHTTDSPSLPLEGLRSSNNTIIATTDSVPETPEPLPIYPNRARANAVRPPRYRSQRDTIIAHLRPSSTMTRPESSIQPRPAPSLLARICDGSVAKLDTPGSDAEITKMTGGGGHARPHSRIAKRISGPSVNDDPSGKSKEAAVTEDEPREALPPHTSHAHLLDRVYVEKAIAAEAHLRTQVRLRTRLAAERRQLARDYGGEGSAGP